MPRSRDLIKYARHFLNMPGICLACAQKIAHGGIRCFYLFLSWVPLNGPQPPPTKWGEGGYQGASAPHMAPAGLQAFRGSGRNTHFDQPDAKNPNMAHDLYFPYESKIYKLGDEVGADFSFFQLQGLGVLRYGMHGVPSPTTPPCDPETQAPGIMGVMDA